jgi:hypothetical protein
MCLLRVWRSQDAENFNESNYDEFSGYGKRHTHAAYRLHHYIHVYASHICLQHATYICDAMR